MTQDRIALIAMGRCIYCRKNKADEGYRSCLQCRMDIREKGDTHSEESKQKHKEWLKRRKDLLYAFGVCVDCGKRDAKEGGHRCLRCIFKANERQTKRRREAGILPRDSYTKDGICYFCGEPVVPGKKTCEKHYKTLKENMLLVRKLRKSENNFELQNKLFWEAKKWSYAMRQGTKKEMTS